jgi:hypothetical protein
MPLPPKEVTCECGHTMTLTIRKLFCVKCGKNLFYNEKEKRRHQFGTIYTVGMFALAVGLITYLFVEMIIRPLFG